MKRPSADDVFSQMALAVFKLNGALIAGGDRLVADLNLTSARWQVLGAAAKSPVPLSIASIARNMGLTRQTVRTTVRDLTTAGLVMLESNPHHQRSQLVVLTASGRHAVGAAMDRQVRWAEEIMTGLDARLVRDAVDVLETLLTQLTDKRSDDDRD